MQPAFASKIPMDEPAAAGADHKAIEIPMDKDVHEAAARLESMMSRGSVDKRSRREFGKAIIRKGFEQIDSLAKAPFADRMRLLSTLAAATR